MIYIYHLLDARGRVRYVGKSKNPYARLQCHYSACFLEDFPLYVWVRSLRFANRAPGVRIVAVCEGEGWDEEKAEIRRQHRKGAKLLNWVHNPSRPKTRREMREKAHRRRLGFYRDRKKYVSMV